MVAFGTGAHGNDWLQKCEIVSAELFYPNSVSQFCGFSANSQHLLELAERLDGRFRSHPLSRASGACDQYEQIPVEELPIEGRNDNSASERGSDSSKTGRGRNDGGNSTAYRDLFHKALKLDGKNFNWEVSSTAAGDERLVCIHGGAPDFEMRIDPKDLESVDAGGSPGRSGEGGR